MPPINTQGSRASLVTAVVVFVILFVASAIFAIYFNVQLRSTEKEYSDYKKNYNGVVADTAFTTPEFTALQSLKSDSTSGDSIMDIALRQRDALAQAITGGAVDPAAVDGVDKSVSDALTAASAKVKSASLTLPSKGLISAISFLSNQVSAQQDQIKKLSDQVAQANKDLADANKGIADQNASRDKSIEDIRTQAAADLQKNVDQLAQLQALVAQLQKDQSDTAAKDQATAQATQTALAAKDQQIAKSITDLKESEDKVANRRPDVSNSVIRQPDGKIVRLPGNDICYINLGEGDQVTPGLTFEVYDRATGVPGIPSHTTGDESLPIGKASIEITRVDPTSSECRIVSISPGAVLSEGDLISNLVYDRNTKYNFYVFGKFDLAESGHPNDADTAIIQRLVTQWGGKLSDQVNVDTDFVVLGAEPQLSNFTKEELDQPLNAAKAEKEKAELDKYQDIRQTALDLHIPILNQNRFLYYVGYYEQAKR
jgi:hypothetical protein